MITKPTQAPRARQKSTEFGNFDGKKEKCDGASYLSTIFCTLSWNSDLVNLSVVDCILILLGEDEDANSLDEVT